VWTYSMLRPLIFAMVFNAVARGFPFKISQIGLSTEACNGEEREGRYIASKDLAERHDSL